MRKEIENARSQGYSDEEILQHLATNYDDLRSPIENAANSGYGPSDILDYIAVTQKERKRLKSPKKEEPAPEPAPEKGFVAGLKRGAKSGVSGLLLGAEEQQAAEDPSLLEHLGELAGSVASDIPAMIGGGLAGGAVGSAAGPVGTVVGAGAGSFALPALIKESFNQYRQHVKQGGVLSFGEFLQRAASVAKETGKGAVVGGVTSQAGKLLPILAKIPGGQKLLSTNLAKKVAEPTAELAALTGTSAALEGRLPTAQEILDNSLVLFGFKISKKAAEAIKDVAFESGKSPEEIVDHLKNAGADISSADKVEEVFKKASLKEQVLQGKRLKQEPRPEPPPPEPPKRSFNEIKDLVEDKVRAAYKEAYEKVEGTPKEQQFFQMVRDSVGKQRGKAMEKRFEVEDILDTELEGGGKLSKQQLQDLPFFMEGTPNPHVKGDTPSDISERMSSARPVVDKLRRFFDDYLKEYNANPATRSIHPRDQVRDIYVPRFFEKASNQKIDDAVNSWWRGLDPKMRKQFKTKNPLANQRVLDSMFQALTEKGLKLKHKDMRGVLREYIDIMSRLEANQELWKDLKDLQKKDKGRYFITSFDKPEYEAAKRAGWVPFDDYFLRTKIVDKDAAGDPVYETSAAPALVNPVAAKALRGVFYKDAFKPESNFWQKYDKASDFLRTVRVSTSLFHYGPITEEVLATMGLKGMLDVLGPKGKTLLNNKEIVVDWTKHGLDIQVPDKASVEEGRRLVNDLIDKIPGQSDKANKAKDVAKSLLGAQHFLFNKYIPQAKLTSAEYYIERWKSKRVADGTPTSKADVKKAKEEIADLVNNQYGGQVWQTQKFFNDPKAMKWMRRVIGYPDWTISRAKTAMNLLAPGLKGDLARRLWLRMALYYFGTHALLQYINGGFTNDDKGKPGWDADKAKKTLTDGDPSKWYMFPLPDVELDILGTKFNPGRDPEGRKLYSHLGKQGLEIPKYFSNTVEQLFAKSNPLIQIGFKQAAGGTPYEGALFPARGTFEGGQFKPWDATKPGTVGRIGSRLTALAEDTLPFSLQTVKRAGALPSAVTLGALPLSKGLTLHKAEPYIASALKNKDIKELNRIVRILKDNGYEEGQIKKTVARVKKEWLQK